MPATAAFTSPLLGTDSLATLLGAADLRILDCSMVREDRPDGTYAFVSGHDQWARGHIPGSVHVDVASQLSDPSAPLPMTMPPVDLLMRRFAELGIGDGCRIVLYDCSNNGWAARVWWLLRVCGVDAAAVLDGGWRKWTAEGRPVSTQATTYAAATLSATPRPWLMADKRRVLASLDQPDVARIYALSPAAYSGAVRLFPRPGRIPRSGNVHCDALLDPATNTYRPLDDMRAMFAPTGALEKQQVITYCGGGIAACSDALALVALGVRDVAVYDGSMNEWTADPSTPLEL